MERPQGYECAVIGEGRDAVRARGIKAFVRRGDLRSALTLLKANWEERAKRSPGTAYSPDEARYRRSEVTALEMECEEARRRANR
jgi:hypothetical protein